MNRTVILVALLAGSIALNLYQWRTSGTAPRAASAAAAGGSEPQLTVSSGGGPARGPAGGDPASGAAAGRASLPGMATTCPGQLARVTGELADLQRKLEERLTLDELFERSPPSGASEERMREALDKVFAKAPAGYGYTVECRGEICNVDVTAPHQDEWDWTQAIQKEGFHGLSDEYAMHGSKPGQDPITKEPITLSRNVVKLRDTSIADGLAALRELYARFESSEARARCTAGDATRGYLVLLLHLDGDERRITYDAGGTLPATALGRCLLEALDAAIAATSLPDPVRSAALYQTLEI